MPNPRSILLGNVDMHYRGGTQAWVRHMYEELSRQHDVSVATVHGRVPRGMTPFEPGNTYDLALINHWPTAQLLRHERIGKRIVTAHGVIPHEELAVLGADAYVACGV